MSSETILPSGDKMTLEHLLAYMRDDIVDPAVRGLIRDLVTRDPYWEAQYESVRFYRMEKEVALADAVALENFPLSEICRRIALMDDAQRCEISPESELDAHVVECVFCRRLVQRSLSRTEAQRWGRGNRMAIDELLEPIYSPVLNKLEFEARIRNAINELIATSEDSVLLTRLEAAKSREMPLADVAVEYQNEPSPTRDPQSVHLPDVGEIDIWKNSEGSLVVSCSASKPAPPPMVLLIPRSSGHTSSVYLPQRSGAIAASTHEDMAKFTDVDQDAYLVVVIPSETEPQE